MGQILEFKQFKDLDNKEKLENMVNIFHQRLTAWNGEHKDLIQLQNELNVINKLFENIKTKEKKAA